MYNSIRSIENSDCLGDNRIVSKCVGRCSMRIRKADNNSILAFKFDLSLLPMLLYYWFACSVSKFKKATPMLRCSEKTDGITLSNSISPCQRTTSKRLAEWINEQSEPFVCRTLKPSPQKKRLGKIKYTFDLTLSDQIFDAFRV